GRVHRRTAGGAGHRRRTRRHRRRLLRRIVPPGVGDPVRRLGPRAHRDRALLAQGPPQERRNGHALTATDRRRAHLIPRPAAAPAAGPLNHLRLTPPPRRGPDGAALTGPASSIPCTTLVGSGRNAVSAFAGVPAASVSALPGGYPAAPGGGITIGAAQAARPAGRDRATPAPLRCLSGSRGSSPITPRRTHRPAP